MNVFPLNFFKYRQHAIVCRNFYFYRCLSLFYRGVVQVAGFLDRVYSRECKQFTRLRTGMCKAWQVLFAAIGGFPRADFTACILAVKVWDRRAILANASI